MWKSPKYICLFLYTNIFIEYLYLDTSNETTSFLYKNTTILFSSIIIDKFNKNKWKLRTGIWVKLPLRDSCKNEKINRRWTPSSLIHLTSVTFVRERKCYVYVKYAMQWTISIFMRTHFLICFLFHLWLNRLSCLILCIDLYLYCDSCRVLSIILYNIYGAIG